MTPLLEVSNLTKFFRQNKRDFEVLSNVSFKINPGEIVGLGGESGCGKTTLAKILMQLISFTSGEICFENENLLDLSRKYGKNFRKKIQMVFQHPSSSLDPRMTIEESLAEPLIIHHLPCERKRLEFLLHQVGLEDFHLDRFPHELSGGQKQRVAIARALALHPLLLICDEPFSALDVSVQSQVIHLLLDLHQKKNLSYFIISHDLSVLRYMCQKMIIMYLGEMVEWGPSGAIFNSPLHPYTQALTASVLSSNPLKQQKNPHKSIEGEIPGIISKPPGCPFSSRCPYSTLRCRLEKPELREVVPGHFVKCHFPLP